VSAGRELVASALERIVPATRIQRLSKLLRENAWRLLGVGALIGAALPAVLGDGFYLSVVAELYLFAVLALSWDLVGGQTGYPSFGQMAFFGVGAYTTAILFGKFSVGFWPGLAAAGLLSLAVAGAIGLVVLRLRGGYFAIATLGILLTFQQVSRNLEITNGPDGISFLSTLPPTTFYYAFLGLLVGEMALVHYLSSTQFGYTLNAIRDDEGKVTAMGVNTTLYKTAAWMIAALFTGMAGGTWSLFNFYVNPFTAYNLAWNVELIAMSLLGGAGTVLGPVLGAFGLHGLIALVIDPYFAGWQLGVLGFVVILTVIALPEGIVGWFQQRASAMEYYEYGGGAAGDEAAGTGATADAEPDPTTEESV
jgi:branched-chain amino acid transport system permease protein